MKDLTIEFTISVDDTKTEVEIEEDIKALLDLLQYKSRNLKIKDALQRLAEQFKRIKELEKYKKSVPETLPYDPWKVPTPYKYNPPKYPSFGDPSPLDGPTYTCANPKTKINDFDTYLNSRKG